ncbi:MAG: relaxase/mobilization nuclease domain-containing protein [Cyanobacteria bacterium J06648_1]
MIGHIEHGSDFGGLFRYLLAEDKGARIIGGNAAGRTPSEFTQEFNNCADQRRSTKKPVKHLIVSFSPTDGYVTDEVKVRIAKEAVKELGYTYNQYVVVDHHRDDPGHDWNHDHDHIHIAVNMITLDGKRVDDWQDKRKFEEVLRQLEVREQLTTVVSSKQRKRKALSHGQTQRIKREIKEFKSGERTLIPQIPLDIKLQAAIDKASEDKPNLTTFVGRLQDLGVDVRPTISDKGRKRISYRLENLKVRGSKLHNGSFPKLISQRSVDFDLRRDKPAMDAAANGQRVSIPIEKQVAWSSIDLVSYLPSAFRHDLTAAQTNREQNKSRSEGDVKGKSANQQQTEFADHELLSIKSQVDSWHKLRPREPRREIIDSIHARVNKLKRQSTLFKQKICIQKLELERLGSPRSLLNPFGVSSDVIEEKKAHIRLNQSKLKDIESDFTKASNNLDEWQEKAIAYQNWQSSPKTQEMERLAALLSTPNNIARLDRISEGHKIYNRASYVLKQLGEWSGETRRFQGEFYRIDKQDQTLTISRLHDDSIIYTARDNQNKEGIIEVKKFDLTEQDKKRLDESVRYLKRQEKLSQKNRHKGFSLG